jgi:hypothetical protein
MHFSKSCLQISLISGLLLMFASLQAQFISDTVYTTVKICAPFHASEGRVTFHVIRQIDTGMMDTSTACVIEVLGRFWGYNTDAGATSEVTYAVGNFDADELRELASNMRSTYVQTEGSATPQTYTRRLKDCLVGSGFVGTNPPVTSYIFLLEEAGIAMRKNDFLSIADFLENAELKMKN